MRLRVLHFSLVLKIKINASFILSVPLSPEKNLPVFLYHFIICVVLQYPPKHCNLKKIVNGKKIVSVR